MALTTIEVIDTAVKIGLGGLITIVGTFIVTRLNHDHEHKKERSKRFFDALEQSSNLIEETTHVALKYWALVIEWVRNRDDGMELAPHRKEELEKIKSDLFNEFKSLTVAESKLLLLGLTVPAAMLREYGDVLKEMRRKCYDGKKSLTEKEMDEVRETILSKRQALFVELSNAYKNGL